MKTISYKCDECGVVFQSEQITVSFGATIPVDRLKAAVHHFCGPSCASGWLFSLARSIMGAV